MTAPTTHVERWDFSALIAPTTPGDFVEHHWERKPLYIRRERRDFYDGLVSLADVDFLLTTHLGKPDFPVSLIGGKTEGRADRPGRKPGPLSLDMVKVHELLRQGATLRIGNTPAYLPALRELATGFEAALNVPVAINLYLTPRCSNAFGAHFDNHDVYILQLEGTKLWRLYEPPEDLPMEVLIPGRSGFFDHPLPGSSVHKSMPAEERVTELKLEAGDLLYVPRGHVHEVRTGDDQSLHLTVGAPAITWYEVLLNALPRVLDGNRALRKGLPPGFAVDGETRLRAGGVADEVAESLNGAVDADTLREALDDLASRFVYSRRLPARGLPGDVDRLDQVGLDSVLRVRHGLVYRLREERLDIHLLFARTHVKVPIRAASMLEHIDTHCRFTVRDLPTQLGDDSRLSLVRSLLAKGFLEIVELGPTAPPA